VFALFNYQKFIQANLRRTNNKISDTIRNHMSEPVQQLAFSFANQHALLSPSPVVVDVESSNPHVPDHSAQLRLDLGGGDLAEPHAENPPIIQETIFRFPASSDHGYGESASLGPDGRIRQPKKRRSGKSTLAKKNTCTPASNKGRADRDGGYWWQD